jgi:hypothetical protein
MGLRAASAESVLDHDPDLAAGLAPPQFALARRETVARMVRYEKGPWTVEPHAFDARGCLGLLIVEGLLVRRVTVGERSCAELLGPGDVTQPWLTVGPEGTVGAEVNWVVNQPLRIAVLDRAFVGRVTRWPEITAALAGRIMLRVYWLSFHLAVCHMRRVDDRVLLVLWHFADRWGRVTPDGIVIPLPLTHSLLAAVVGARRPSVTTAVRSLVNAGQIAPRRHSQWLLCGDPPPEFQEAREYAARYDRSLPPELRRA